MHQRLDGRQWNDSSYFFFNDPGELGRLMKKMVSPVVLYDHMAIIEDVTAHALQRDTILI